MSTKHERDPHDQQLARTPTTSAEAAVPGQKSRSGTLRRPTHPVPSALSGGHWEAAETKSRHPADVAGESDPPWITNAQAYNAAHAHLGSEFKELTGGECLDDAKQLSPQKVAAWQAARALLADGKVGPQTVSAARTQSRLNRAAPLEGAPAAHAMFEKARAFNAKHPELVAEFNELTAYFCVDIESNELVPEAVAKWQKQHDEPADGMITTDTIAAAKLRRLNGATP